jgi:hypothetical protein
MQGYGSIIEVRGGERIFWNFVPVNKQQSHRSFVDSRTCNTNKQDKKCKQIILKDTKWNTWEPHVEK